MKQSALPKKYVKISLNNSRGLSLLVLVMVLTVAAAAAVSIIVLRVKLQSVQRESLTKIHLDTIRTALQHYYLVHHDLPEAETTPPPKKVPVKALNLDQRYRLDAQGQFFHYDRLPAIGNTDILGIIVNNTPVAAVLVAAGPDGVIADTNLDNPYDAPDAPSDDIVMGVPLRAEATKIAQWSVEVLQRAAIAYNGLFENINNNGFGDALIGEPSNGDTYYPVPEEVDPDPLVIGDEYFVTPDPIVRDELEIDENECEETQAGTHVTSSTFGCLHFGILGNDPGILDDDPYCVVRLSFINCQELGLSLAEWIVEAYGLNRKYVTDPWGNHYQWRSTDPDDPDPNLLVFYSMGPDRVAFGGDDIVATERLPPP